MKCTKRQKTKKTRLRLLPSYLTNFNKQFLTQERTFIMFTLPYSAQPYSNGFILNVTPAMAQQWLKHNDFNRPLNQRLVEKYAGQMRAGNWQRTHQGIAFDSRGIILDGQHRL
jgi:hypothetical protein